MSPEISRFCEFYKVFSTASLANMKGVYAERIVFEDPVHRISGLSNLTNYFERTLSNVNECRFEITQIIEQEGKAFVSWTMNLSHSKLQSGKLISVPGVSQLQYDGRIYFHRDYFDMGQMLYEQLPLLGAIVRRIKHRLAS